MVLSKRERNIAIVTGAAVALLLLDYFALSPILVAYDQLRADQKLYTDNLAHAHALLLPANQAKDKALWDQMVADGLKSDAADTGNALEHAVFDWAQALGLVLKSCTPERASRKDRTEVVLYVVGAGPMSAVAQFLYQAQISRLPVKPEDLEITSRREGADDLTLTMHLSGLYFPADAKAAPSTGPAASVTGGNRS